MDPNAALARIRNAMNGTFDPDGDVVWSAVVELIDAVTALDVWMSSGGFAPDDWAGAR